MPNCEPWLLWIVIAYTVSTAPSRAGLNVATPPRRSNEAASPPAPSSTTTPMSPLKSRSP